MSPLLEIQNLRKGFVSPEGERIPIIDVPQFEMNANTQIALQAGVDQARRRCCI